MAETDWLVAGLLIGLVVGIPLGWILFSVFQQSASASVVFDRDKETNLITGIHYVPVGGKI